MVRVFFLLLAFAVCLVAGCAHDPESSGLTVRTTGDAQLYGVYRHNFSAPDRR